MVAALHSHDGHAGKAAGHLQKKKKENKKSAR